MPDFKIVSAVVHLNEKSPHAHIVGIPIGHGYKRGMKKQAAKTKVFTTESLHVLQEKMHQKAGQDMEEHPEIFNGESLKEIEKGRNNVRRRIEIGFNSEFNSRRLPIRSRSNIYDCTHISEQPHIIVALFGSRNYPVLKQGHDLFRLCNNRELKSQPFEL